MIKQTVIFVNVKFNKKVGLWQPMACYVDRINRTMARNAHIDNCKMLGIEYLDF